MSSASLRFSLAVFGLAAACGEEPAPRPKPSRDAALVRDLGASPEDDAGARADAGEPTDAGEDAGPPDAGTEPDEDGDRLPDAVDPDPTRPNPMLFEDDFGASDPTWLFSSVAMGIEPATGHLAVRRLEPFEREGWIGPRPAWSDYVVQARLRVTSTGTSERPESGHAGLIARAEQVTPSRYITCGLDLRRGQAILAEHRGTRVTDLGSADAPVGTGEWVTVTLASSGEFYTCDIDGVRLTGRSDGLIGGSVGFRSFDATFDADWIRVFDLF